MVVPAWLKLVERTPPPSERTPVRFTPPVPPPLNASVIAPEMALMPAETLSALVLLLFAQFDVPLRITEPVPLIVAAELELDAIETPPLPTVRALPLVFTTEDVMPGPAGTSKVNPW